MQKEVHCTWWCFSLRQWKSQHDHDTCNMTPATVKVKIWHLQHDACNSGGQDMTPATWRLQQWRSRYDACNMTPATVKVKIWRLQQWRSWHDVPEGHSPAMCSLLSSWRHTHKPSMCLSESIFDYIEIDLFNLYNIFMCVDMHALMHVYICHLSLKRIVGAVISCACTLG